jgi:hypothetical protein
VFSELREHCIAPIMGGSDESAMNRRQIPMLTEDHYEERCRV